MQSSFLCEELTISFWPLDWDCFILTYHWISLCIWSEWLTLSETNAQNIALYSMSLCSTTSTRMKHSLNHHISGVGSVRCENDSHECHKLKPWHAIQLQLYCWACQYAYFQCGEVSAAVYVYVQTIICKWAMSFIVSFRIQSSYSALQRINQDLEEKIHRNVSVKLSEPVYV